MRWFGALVLVVVAMTVVPSIPATAASPVLAKWVQPMPMLPGGVATPIGKYNDGEHGVWDLYEIRMTQFTQSFHPALPLTKVWGYNGYTPGPIIVAHSGTPVYVRYWNNLPTTPLIGRDYTLPGGDLMKGVISPAVPHLHGAKVEQRYDGEPDQWFTPGYSRVNFYPNDQRSTLLWFHDHALTVTRTNVYAGLAGGYVLRDDRETSLNLPAPPYEMAMVIQDRLFKANGQLDYPLTSAPPYSEEPEFFGDTITVNGKVWPYVNVYPRKYRLRLLNGSNSRFYNLSFGPGNPILQQIGNEGGLLPATANLTSLLIAPGERADVIVDFSNYKGQRLLLSNDAPTPYPSGDPVTADTSKILQFRVYTTLPKQQTDLTVVPANPAGNTIPRMPTNVARIRDLTLTEGEDQYGRTTPRLNDMGSMDPATEICREGTTEIWRVFNMTMDAHPIHLHLVNFVVMQRRAFSVPTLEKYGLVRFTGMARGPDPNEMGTKETVRMNPGDMTQIIMHFPESPNHAYTGSYVWHCHILEHEENDMMRPLVVEPSGP
jgi:spore coat protein A, manganese oxidase